MSTFFFARLCHRGSHSPQRVLPQEPLCDVLQRYQALGLPSRGLRNKEFLPLTQKDLDLCADAWRSVAQWVMQ